MVFVNGVTTLWQCGQNLFDSPRSTRGPCFCLFIPIVLRVIVFMCLCLTTMWLKSFNENLLDSPRSTRGPCFCLFIPIVLRVIVFMCLCLTTMWLKSFNENLLDSPRSTRGPCCASPALGGSYSQEDNLSYQVDDDDDCHDGDYFLMWKYENGNYRKQPNQAQWYLKGG